MLTKKKMQLVQWHTAPPKVPVYKEYTKITLSAPYARATPELQTRLDEFVSFLTEKDYRPQESFTELTYRYRREYGKAPPLFMSHIALFVRVASVLELQAAVSAGWTWDRIVPYSPGPDCNGIPGNLWKPHTYADNAQGYMLPVRDPSHNYGITRIEKPGLGTVSEMYACCGKDLSHPGCWTGEKKYELVPYDMAPGFGTNVWRYVVRKDWDTVQRLWLREPRKGSMWLHNKQYEAWDKRIRTGKESLADAIVEVLKRERGTNGIDLNPMGKLEPLDRATLQSLLELQKRWNAIQCSSAEYDLFNLDEGKRAFSERLSLFTSQPNSTYEAEFSEIDAVEQAHPNISLFDAYRSFVRDQQTLDERLAAVPMELQGLPQFRPLLQYMQTRVIGNATIRSGINNVITGQSEIYTVPSFADTLSHALQMRINAFSNIYSQGAMIKIPAEFPGLMRSQGLDPYPTDLLNQFLVLNLLKEGATEEDVQAIQAADAKQLEHVQRRKAKLAEVTLRKADEAKEQLRKVGNKDFISTFSARVKKMIDACNDGTYAEFIVAQNAVEESILASSNVFDEFEADLNFLKIQIRALEQKKQSLLQERKRLAPVPKVEETLDSVDAAESMRDTLQQQVNRFKAIPTDAQIAAVVDYLRSQNASQEWIDRAEKAETLQELEEIEAQFGLLPPLFFENIQIWKEDWPEEELDEGFVLFDVFVSDGQLLAARGIYDELKKQYEQLLEEFLSKAIEKAKALLVQVLEYVPSKDIIEFEANYKQLLKTGRYRPAKNFLQNLINLHKRITEDTVKQEDKIELIKKIDSEDDTVVYEQIRNSADNIETKQSLLVIITQFVNLKKLTKDLTKQLVVLKEEGHTDEDLEPLWAVRNDPKLTSQDVENAFKKFEALKNSLPKLFPVTSDVIYPKNGYTEQNMQTFCKSLPSSGIDELDSVLKQYCKAISEKLLFWYAVPAGYSEFLAVLKEIPKKKSQWLLEALKGDVNTVPRNYGNVYTAIQTLRSLKLLTEDVKIVTKWNFISYSLIESTPRDMRTIFRRFLDQTLDEKYRQYSNFMQFVDRLRNSEYVNKYSRYLKKLYSKCNKAFIGLLKKMEDQEMDTVNKMDYSSFTTCLDHLEGIWTFVYDFKNMDLLTPKTLTKEQLEIIQQNLSQIFIEKDMIARFPKLYELSEDVSGSQVDKACLLELVEYLRIVEGKRNDAMPEPTEVRECLKRALYAKIIENLKNVDILQKIIDLPGMRDEKLKIVEVLRRGGAIKEEPE